MPIGGPFAAHLETHLVISLNVPKWDCNAFISINFTSVDENNFQHVDSIFNSVSLSYREPTRDPQYAANN